MSVRGIFQSHQAIAGERQDDLSARVLMTGYAGMAPLLALSAGMPTDPTDQISFGWLEDTHLSGNQTVVTGGNSAAVSIVVDDAGIWTLNTILMNQNTGEHMLVTSIAADGITVGLLRGLSGTTAATISTGHKLQSIGTAFAEGSGKPQAVTQQGEERTNYTQIFKNGWAITGTAKKIRYLTGSKMAHNKTMCFAYHAEDMERAFLWGRKGSRIVSGARLSTSNGILAQIEGYGGLVESATDGVTAGNYSMKLLQSFFRKIFDFNAKGMPNERIAFCGSQVLELIQHMVTLDTTYNIAHSESAYGIKVMTINGINGTIKFVTHPMMVENPIWQSELYILHPGLIKKRRFRDTWTEEFSPEKQNNNGIDATEGYIADDLGFELKGARTMGILRNIQKAVKSFA